MSSQKPRTILSSTQSASMPELKCMEATMFLPVELKCMETTMFNSFKRKGKIASVVNMLEDCLLTELQSNEPLRRNCTIYRPWYSPYSYFVCVDKESPVDSSSFPDMLRGREIPVDSHQETFDSLSSSSDSLEHTHPLDNSSRKTRNAAEAKDCITSHDILLACKGQPRQQNGYKCMACCRMFPTLHSLKTHIKCGSKEGFSCKVYYHKLKALWEKEHKCRPSNRSADSGNSSSNKMLK